MVPLTTHKISHSISSTKAIPFQVVDLVEDSDMRNGLVLGQCTLDRSYLNLERHRQWMLSHSGIIDNSVVLETGCCILQVVLEADQPAN